MSVALREVKRAVSLSRETVRVALSRAVESGVLSLDAALEVMAAYDAGTLDREELARVLGEDDDSHAGLAVFAVALAAALIAARRTTAVRWAWDAARLEYVAPSGEALAPAALRRVVDVAVDRAAVPMIRSAARAARLDVPLAEWSLKMHEWCAERHIMAAAAARGGVKWLTPGDKLFLRERILREYDFLSGFEDAVRASRVGGAPLSEAQIAARIALYAAAVRSTYEAMRERIAVDIGFDEVRNVLGVAEHCELCLTETARGWVPIGALVPIGQRSCQANDRCTLRFRKRPTARA